MGATWGKLEATFGTDPKWDLLGDELGVHRMQAAGCVAALWSWALLHAPDGHLGRLSAKTIARAAQWDGDAETFVAACLRCETIDDTPDGYVIHGLGARMERLDSAREQTAKRMKKMRGAKSDSVTFASRDAEVTQESESESERESEKDPPVVPRDAGDGGGDSPPQEPEAEDTGADVLAERERLCREHERDYPEDDDKEQRAAERLSARPGWRAVLAKYIADDWYGPKGWLLKWLERNYAAVQCREPPPTKHEARAGPVVPAGLPPLPTADDAAPPQIADAYRAQIREQLGMVN